MDNPIRYEDLFGGDIESGLEKLIEKVQSTKDELLSMLKEVRTEAKGIGNALSGSSSSTSEGRNNTTNQAVKVEELYEAYQKLGVGVDYCEKNLKNLLATRDREVKAAKLAKTVNDTQATSIARLKAELGLAKLAFEGMHEWQRKNTDEGQLLARTITNLDGIVKNYEQSLKNTTKTQKAQSQNNKKEKIELIDLENAYLKLRVDVEEVSGQYNKFGEVVQGALENVSMSEKDKTKAINQGIIANEAAKGSYREMEAEYKLLTLLLDNMTEEQRKSADMGLILEERAYALRDAMKAQKESVGDSTLSVGNYEKAMNGLNIATKQVLREMPTLANSFSQFFIAISNNIPIFVDALKRASKEAGSTKKALESLITVQFLLEGAMLVALTVLSKYASKWLSSIKIFQNANKVLKQSLDLHKQLFEAYDNVANAISQEGKMEEAVLERRVEALRAQNASLGAIQQAENALLAVRQQNIEAAKNEYKNNLLGSDVVKDYTNNVANWIAATTRLRNLQQDATADVKRSGEIKKRYKDAIEAAQAEVDYYKQRVDAAEELINAERDLALERSETAARQYAERYELFQKELQAERETQDISLALTANKYEREREIAVTETERTIEDLRNLMDKAPEWLSPKQREEYEKQIGLLRKKLTQDLIDLFHEEEDALISIRNNTTIQTLGIMAEGQEKELELLKENTKQKQDELMRRILYERDLADTERKELIKQWSLVAKEGSQAEKNVILNYAQRDLNTALNYKLAIIASHNTSEYKIERDSIDAQIEYWEQYLDNIKKYGNLSESELDNLELEISTEIINLQTQKKNTKFTSWGDLLGIDSNTFGQIEDMFGKSFDYMQEWMDKRIEMAEVAVEAAQKESEAAKTALDYEMEARANGYANNVELARKEYEDKLKLEKEAIAEKERLEKIQEKIDTATQLSSLVTATAELWSAHASIPIAGVALAIAATAAMWGSFLAAKAKASQLTKYGEGMSEYLDYGGSHASGNDIDFGADKNGRRRRVERGEMIGVINKRNVEKYGVDRISDIIASLNKGTFENKYGGSVVESIVPEMNADLYHLAFAGLERDTTDLGRVEASLQTLVEQGETRIVTTPYGRIEYRGNNKRIIRNS